MTIDRRSFLRRSALIAAGAVAADQVELLERLTWRRRFFPSVDTSQHVVGLLKEWAVSTSDGGLFQYQFAPGTEPYLMSGDHMRVTTEDDRSIVSLRHSDGRLILIVSIHGHATRATMSYEDRGSWKSKLVL